MDQNVRLQAEVVDKATGPLARIKAALSAIEATPGIKAARSELAALEKSIGGVRAAAGGGWNLIGSLGFAGGSIASIGAIASSLNNLAKQSLELRHVSRETGLASQELRALQKTGEAFQIAPDSVIRNVENFADRMALLRRGLGEAAGELRQKAPGIFGQLKGSKDNLDALDKYLSFLGKLKDPQQQKQFADLLGLGDMTRMFTDGPEKFAESWRKSREAAGKDKGFDDEAKRMADSMRDLNNEIEKLERRAAPPLFKAIADTVKSTLTDIENIEKLYNKGKEFIFGKDQSPTAGAGSKEADAQGRLQKAEGELKYYQNRWPLKDHMKEKELAEEIRKLKEELQAIRQGGATFQNQSYGGGGFGGLIQKAMLGGGPGGGYGGGARGGYGGPSGAAGDGGVADTPASRVQRALRGGGSIGDASGGRRGRQRGANAAGARESYDFWVAHGLSPQAAAGLVGMEEGESHFNPRAVGDGGSAHGAFQHHGDRRRQIFRGTGIDIDTATHQQQLEAALWEMTKGPDVQARKAWRLLQNAKTPGEGAAIGVHLFERPGDKAGESIRRGARANTWYDMFHNKGIRPDSGQGGSAAGNVYSRYRAEVERRARAGELPSEEADDATDFRRYRGGSTESLFHPTGRTPKVTANGGRGMSRLRDDQVAPPGSMMAPGDAGMLDRARAAGLAGGSQRLDGSIGATFTFKNPPAGLSIETKTSGVVEEKRVDRGMSLAQRA